MLLLEQPVELPEVLDALIVGGGPAGTAAAFRLKELGATALVVDYDDLLKRIRDYAKDKPILPGFGGGDQMQFPAGGPLVSSLHFGPIDKDEMCRQWKSLYREHSVPAKIGVELTGLDQQNGVWKVETWNHNTKENEHFLARHVVLAFGRGVPRRFDIPGDVEGIAYRLSDAQLYVEHPICVIGGGTSAAEAVIAISNAKARKSDPCPVYWSYRGDKMPKVSKALADVFFEAYVGNGNIRYLPHSEPVAILRDAEGSDYLCLRTDRKVIDGRPTETTQLEFLKNRCIACIGEDLPEALLNSVGIFLTSGGPYNRKRLMVSPLLETGRSNLYLAGDMLSPAYLETQDFNADPSTLPERKRRGNVKAALRDGVLVAEVVSQKLAGKKQIQVTITFAEEPQVTEVEGEKRPAAAAPEAPQPAPARLIRLLQGNTTAEEFPLPENKTVVIGRQTGEIRFPDDTGLSDRHASVTHGPGGYLLKDEGGLNGVFIQIAPGRDAEVPPRSIVRAGSQWLVFGDAANRRSVNHHDARGKLVRKLTLADGTVIAGRDGPGINLDSSDSALSRRHFSLSTRGDQIRIRDLESTNGTLLKIDSPTALQPGDRVWVGHQVLQFSMEEADSPPNEVSFDTGIREIAPPPPAAEEPSDGEPSVTFQGIGKSVPIRAGQTICEAAEEAGIAIVAQCHRGICGSDPIRIVSGQENLNAMADGEEETLDDLCSLSPKNHRLACLARVKGPVVVEIIEQD